MSSEYLCIPRGSSDFSLESRINSETLTVVVNPDDYVLDALKPLSAPVWFWFLKKLSPPIDAPSGSPLLFANALLEIQRRSSFLLSLVEQSSALIVVSDYESEEMCRAKGLPVVLSPPPVGSAPRRLQRDGRESASIAFLGDFASLSSYQRASYEDIIVGLKPGYKSERFFLDSSHVVVAGDSIIRGFPYGAALGFASGKTVISEPLTPHWGLEPGIDYIEFSTPEELEQILRHILRDSMLTKLMSERGWSKGRLFEAAPTFDRILRGGAHHPHN